MVKQSLFPCIYTHIPLEAGFWFLYILTICPYTSVSALIWSLSTDLVIMRSAKLSMDCVRVCVPVGNVTAAVRYIP
jgi:hypothetical protein